MEEQQREAAASAPDTPGDPPVSAPPPGTDADAVTGGQPTAAEESAATASSSEDATVSGSAEGATVAASGGVATAAGSPTRSQSAAARAKAQGRGGTAGIFAGVAVIAPVLIRELALESEPFLLLPLTMIILAVALSGFRVAQGGRDGTVGRLGLLVAAAGAIVLTVMFTIMAYLALVQNTRLQSGTWLLQWGFSALVIGILIFGSATLVAGVISRGPTLLMMVSLVLGILLDRMGAFPGLRFRWGPDVVLGQGMHYGLKIFGLSLIWLGYSILKDSKAQSTAVARSA